jgi:superfamily I DNA/RNA helicase
VQNWIDDRLDAAKNFAKKKLITLLKDDIAEFERQAWKKGKDSGYQNGSSEGKKSGHEQGYSKGYEEGLKKGFEDGQTVYRIVDERTPFVPKSVDDALYGPTPFSIGHDMEQLMRSEVATAAEKKIVGRPTDEQWAMILNPHPAVCVSAGAGSGKSTTLVLRIVFMVQHLNIPLESITVVSFTNASCRDLRDKLAHVLGYWKGKKISPKSLEHTVCTFHSALNRLTRRTLDYKALFEFIKDKVPENSEALDELEVDNPGVSTKLTLLQQSLLDEIYREVYREDEEFRKSITQLMRCELTLRRAADPGYKDFAFRYASQRENAIIREIANIWNDTDWAKLDIRRGPIEVFTVKGQKFYADGQVGTVGPYILLGLPHLKGKDVEIDVDGIDRTSLSAAMTSRHRIFSAYCESSVVTIRNTDDLKLLKILIEENKSGSMSIDTINPPKFSVCLPGEFKPVPLTEALFQQASFITSLGCEVTHLLNQFPAPKRPDSYEYTFATVLGKFWPKFESFIQARKIQTFDRIFMLAGDNAATMDFDRIQLGRMRHLLVDEFQDISPVIADTLTSIQSRVASDGSFVSIMAIGDDWQSIYGWRGSSPELFVSFHKYFRSHRHLGDAKPIKLTTNFRSIPDIVTGAAKLIDRVRVRDHKICVAYPRPKTTDHGIRLASYKDIAPKEEDLVANLQAFILNQYKESLLFEEASNDHVLVMARSNRFLKKVSSGMRKHKGLLFRTYHKAKGLEADIAIMLEDCKPGENYPLRDAIYEASKRFPLGQTYTLAKSDEAYRLAYVGVTRGRRRVHWFVPDIKKSSTAAVYGS